MKEINGKILYQGKEYEIVFNLNVMEEIQNEYGSISAWGEKTVSSSEPDIKALIFGIRAMINEAIEIHNDETSSFEPLLTHKQVGRLITAVGIENATNALHDTIIASTESGEKNA